MKVKALGNVKYNGKQYVCDQEFDMEEKYVVQPLASGAIAIVKDIEVEIVGTINEPVVKVKRKPARKSKK